MKNRFSGLYVMALVGLIVLPTAASLGWFMVTKDPNLRPLGVTEESLRAYDRGGGEGVRIVADIEWVEGGAGGLTQRQVERAIRQAFAVKGIEVFVFFHDGVTEARVTYRVRSSTIGPFPVRRAAQGINAAVDAYRMHAPIS
ncbi:hypothetical protein [Maritimibacter sp. DP1N21-5]|uniref:hypothetical protein n=1 Tax=Maritimibacter sp. DP1N21-5 TaxID=2836867 RepID=UPI001C48A982|nr:hypothetical protein [Maritimibacter sp. DP1N21-5]MBV7410888.1 hypothetical protein [Maritimibacter sp. DP1N21-5]